MSSYTPRRSRRFQPIVSSAPLGALQLTDESYAWSSEPVQTRPAQAEDFLHDEDGANFDEEHPGETTFYSSYQHRVDSGTVKPATGKGKGKAPVRGEPEEYTVGDTVLVKTSTAKPSVAVIVAMWSAPVPAPAKGSDDDDEEDAEDEEEDGPKNRMVIQVHWFLQPSELPTYRAKRESADVRAER
jgi:origin recognition complex subunit 1